MAELTSELRRIDAELGAKSMIEVRQVAESCVQCDLDHFVRPVLSRKCGFAQARAQNVLMWGYASDLSSFKEFRRVIERQTTISGSVLMGTLEALSQVAEQQRSRRHHLRAKRRAVLKGSLDNYCDRNRAVLFLERAVLRSRGTHHVACAPTVSARQDVGSNFPQVSKPQLLLL